MQLRIDDGGVLTLSPNGSFASEDGLGSGSWDIVEQPATAEGQPAGNLLRCVSDAGVSVFEGPVSLGFDNFGLRPSRRLVLAVEGQTDLQSAWNGVLRVQSATVLEYDLVDPDALDENGLAQVLKTLTLHGEVRLEPELSHLTVTTAQGAAWLVVAAPLAGQNDDNRDLLTAQVSIRNRIGDQWVPLSAEIAFAGRWRLGDGELRFETAVDDFGKSVFIGATAQLKAVAAGLEFHLDEGHTLALLTIEGQHRMGTNADQELVWKLQLGYDNGGLTYDAKVSGGTALKIGSHGQGGTVRLGGNLSVNNAGDGTRIKLDLQAAYELQTDDLVASVVFKAVRPDGGKLDLQLNGQLEANAGEFKLLFKVDYGESGLVASFSLNDTAQQFHLLVDLVLKPGEKPQVGLNFTIRLVWVNGHLVRHDPEAQPLPAPSDESDDSDAAGAESFASPRGLARPVKMLLLPGVGGNHHRRRWAAHWTKAIEAAMQCWAPAGALQVESVSLDFDDLFRAAGHDLKDWVVGLRELLSSGLLYGFKKPGAARAASRGMLSDIGERVRWTAGMVMQWAADPALRAKTRELVREACLEHQPDIVVGHSLGSLIAYDTFRRPEHAALLHDAWLVCFGSQIGNAFVRRQFGGRIEPLDARCWYQLYNPRDDVLVTPLELPLPVEGPTRYQQVLCEFDWPGLGDHGAVGQPGQPGYLDHPSASHAVWRPITERLTGLFKELPAGQAPAWEPPKQADFTVMLRSENRHRALLVGINNYPDPEARLSGCVNDVYLMSEVLQELGFPASGVRLLLDERATADGIRDRLTWLLSSTTPGSQRVLFYSGHGAQIPAYGVGESVDSLDECLVPHDFDWSLQRAILDDDLYQLYSQVSYDARVTMVFDCCHSGGIARGGVKVKGLTPPADILHRRLHWDAATGLWADRRLPSTAGAHSGQTAQAAASGIGQRRELGGARDLTERDRKQYEVLRSTFGHQGPYRPVILEACQEHEYAYEYQQGLQSYGAFTFHLAHEFRQARAISQPVTFRELVQRVATDLADLGYAQQPNIEGPEDWVAKPVGP